MIDFFKALWETIVNYFNTPVDIGNSPLITGNILIWSILIGIAAATVFSFLNRITLGKFVSGLLENKADSPETAISADKIGGAGRSVLHSLKKNCVFGKIVKRVNGNSNEVRYYILPEDASRAENLFGKNGTSIRSLIFTLISLIIIAALAYYALPRLTDMTRSVANSFASLAD